MFHRITKFLILGAAIASPLLAGPAAATDFIREREYYSDATYTVQVGFWMNNCQRQFRGWGEVTPYYITVSEEPCEGNWPPKGWNPGAPHY